MTLAVDMSSWGAKAQMKISGKAMTPEIVKGLWAEGARRAIVGVSDVALAREQLQVCAAGGLELQAYSFMYFGADNGERLDRVRRAAEGLTLTKLWVDLEHEDAPIGQPGAVANWCLDCVALAERLEWPIGVYSAAWWWRRWLGEWDGLHDLPLYVAQYDEVPNLSFAPFGGWDACEMKQYKGTTDLAGYSVDLNFYQGAEPMPEVIDLTARQTGKQNEVRQRLVGLILSGKPADADEAFWTMQYLRLMAGLPITQ